MALPSPGWFGWALNLPYFSDSDPAWRTAGRNFCSCCVFLSGGLHTPKPWQGSWHIWGWGRAGPGSHIEYQQLLECSEDVPVEDSALERDQFLPAVGPSALTAPLSRKLWPSLWFHLGHNHPEGVGTSQMAQLSQWSVCTRQRRYCPPRCSSGCRVLHSRSKADKQCLPAQIPCPGKPNRKLAGWE